MAYTVTEEITYSGSEFDVTVLSPLEMFQLYKTEHSVAESATTAFNNATGLTSVDVSKPSDSVVRHVSVWEDQASYDTWRAATTPIGASGDWSYAEISKVAS